MTASPVLRRLNHRVETTRDRILAYATAQRLSVADLAEVRLPWYDIRDADTAAETGGGDAGGARTGFETRPPTVYIYDEIGGSLGVTAKRFAKDLNDITASLIHVRVNSPGGALFEGRTIMNVLRDHPARIVAFVDGIAASAASIVILGADEIVVGPNAEIMIHDGSMTVDGNAADLAKGATFLDRESEGIADLYRQRAGGTTAEWRELMLAETWLFGPEAVKFGLADRFEELTPRPPADLAQRMARSFDLGRYRYAGRADAPAPQRRAAGPAEVTERPEPAASLPSLRRRLSSDSMMREAAVQRRSAVRPGMTPLARRSAPAGVGDFRRAAFPAKMRAQMVEWNGQRRYHINGHASVYEVRYEMWDQHGPYWEVVSRRAGAKSLGAEPDTAYLTNHAGITMARTTNGSLLLAEDEVGLAYDAYLNPKRSDVELLVTAIQDEDVTENSFAFRIPDGGGQWNTDFTEYRINEYDIDRGDVSAVTYGANPYTDVSARAREVLDDVDHLPDGAARVALERLEARMGRRVTDLAAEVGTFDAPAYAPTQRAAELEADPPAATNVGTGDAREDDQEGRSIASIEAMLAMLD